MNLYPLLMAPTFRHGEQTPWGGHMLRNTLMKDAPQDATGESLEISALPGHESMVANGPHAGKPLSRMAELWGSDLTGSSEGGFPLLLKLLDTQKPLSVQVHPGDAYAIANEGTPGKSEAWIILNAEPGAKIVYGLETDGASLKDVLDQGKLEQCLRWRTVRPGEVYYIPVGLVHALGEGILCYEIEKTSDITYRLWDWDRADAEGNYRELHISKALDVCRPELHPEKNEGTTVLCQGGSRTYYVCDNHFELCRLNLSGRMPLEDGRMLFLMPLGQCQLRWSDGEMTLNPFDSVLVPAALKCVELSGNTKVLMSCLPNRAALIEELGYRAANVDGLMDEEGA